MYRKLKKKLFHSLISANYRFIVGSKDMYLYVLVIRWITFHDLELVCWKTFDEISQNYSSSNIQGGQLEMKGKCFEISKFSTIQLLKYSYSADVICYLPVITNGFLLVTLYIVKYSQNIMSKSWNTNVYRVKISQSKWTRYATYPENQY